MIARDESLVKCSKCGEEYTLVKRYEVDTWNLGNYGCTWDNAPRRFIGTEDPGCPNCKRIDRELKEAKKPRLVKTYVEGDTKYTLYAEPVSYDSFATQTNGTINFDLGSDAAPRATFHQWKLIRAMERELGIAFTGTTIVDAQEFISENIDEFNRLHDEENLTVSKDIYEL